MITLSSDTRVKLLLPHTNRALAQAIQSAEPEQLALLKEGKDIKSLLTSAFQDKISSAKSDQTLLELLKNSTAFKTMGNLSDTLKPLVSGLKSIPEFSAKASVLEGFLNNIASLDPGDLQSRIANGGVFLESKIAASLTVLPTLRETLESLKTLLSQSTLSDAKALHSTIASLLESPVLNRISLEEHSAKELLQGLRSITDALKTILSKPDVLYSPRIARFAEQLDGLAASAPSAQEIKTTLSQLYGALLTSSAEGSNAVLDGIETLLKTLSSSADPADDLKHFSPLLRRTMAGGDGAVFGEGRELLARLEAFCTPAGLPLDTALGEELAHDLKAQLLTLSQELSGSSDPQSAALLEHADRLLTLIDYHQLVSHLSTSASIYIPFEWDLLEEGSLSFKKTRDKKFYCEINLTLKEYGKLDLMMALYGENQLEIQAHTENPAFKALIEEHLPRLRSLLIDAGLTPRRIRIFATNELSKNGGETYVSEKSGSDLGFEVTV